MGKVVIPEAMGSYRVLRSGAYHSIFKVVF